MGPGNEFKRRRARARYNSTCDAVGFGLEMPIEQACQDHSGKLARRAQSDNLCVCVCYSAQVCKCSLGDQISLRQRLYVFVECVFVSVNMLGGGGLMTGGEHVPICGCKIGEQASKQAQFRLLVIGIGACVTPFRLLARSLSVAQAVGQSLAACSRVDFGRGASVKKRRRRRRRRRASQQQQDALR